MSKIVIHLERNEDLAKLIKIVAQDEKPAIDYANENIGHILKQFISKVKHEMGVRYPLEADCKVVDGKIKCHGSFITWEEACHFLGGKVQQISLGTGPDGKPVYDRECADKIKTWEELLDIIEKGIPQLSRDEIKTVSF